MSRSKRIADPPMSDREIRNAALSRRAAAEGMVLLKTTMKPFR